MTWWPSRRRSFPRHLRAQVPASGAVAPPGAVPVNARLVDDAQARRERNAADWLERRRLSDIAMSRAVERLPEGAPVAFACIPCNDSVMGHVGPGGTLDCPQCEARDKRRMDEYSKALVTPQEYVARRMVQRHDIQKCIRCSGMQVARTDGGDWGCRCRLVESAQ